MDATLSLLSIASRQIKLWTIVLRMMDQEIRGQHTRKGLVTAASPGDHNPSCELAMHDHQKVYLQ